MTGRSEHSFDLEMSGIRMNFVGNSIKKWLE